MGRATLDIGLLMPIGDNGLLIATTSP